MNGDPMTWTRYPPYPAVLTQERDFLDMSCHGGPFFGEEIDFCC